MSWETTIGGNSLNILLKMGIQEEGETAAGVLMNNLGCNLWIEFEGKIFC